jgi:PKD repeat protein
MASWAEVLQLQLTEVSESTTTVGHIRFMLSETSAYAYTYMPVSSSMFHPSGDVHLAPAFDRTGDTNGFQMPPGQHGYVSLVHEVGHAIGLKHPHEGTALLPAAEDNHSFTVMSHNFLGASPGTPMAYDILAAQHLYGARPSRAGDDVYRFSRSELDQFEAGGEPSVPSGFALRQAIWDAGGRNVIDLSGVAGSPSGYWLDLRPFGWLTTKAAHRGSYFVSGTSLGPGVRIHGLINSTGDDAIHANADANVFRGYAPGRTTGADVIAGAGAADAIDLSAYPRGSVSQTASGDDLVLGLGARGTITVKGYFAGDRPEIILSDAAPQVSIGDTRVVEGTGGTTEVLLAVTLSAPVPEPVAVDYATADGTATDASDYIAVRGTLVFAPGETRRHVGVIVVGDSTVESEEGFSVLIGAPSAGVEVARSQGDIAIVDDDVRLNQAPVAVPAAGPTRGVAPLSVRFSSAGSRDPDGRIVSAVWAFGTGDTTGADGPGYLYSAPGAYTATLTVTDDAGATAVNSIVVIVDEPANRPPVAVLTAGPTSGLTPLTVRFSSAGSSDGDGRIVSTVWTFGTGASSTAAHPSFVYTAPGTYDATLVVTDDDGATASRSVRVVVGQASNRAPVAAITVTRVVGPAPLTPTFFGIGSHDPDGVLKATEWTFGDGGVAAGLVAAHTYTRPGIYIVTLKVTDAHGASGASSVAIVVTEPAR